MYKQFIRKNKQQPLLLFLLLVLLLFKDSDQLYCIIEMEV